MSMRLDAFLFGAGIFIIVLLALFSVDPILQNIFYIVSSISVLYALGQKIVRDIRKEVQKMIEMELKSEIRRIICTEQGKMLCEEEEHK